VSASAGLRLRTWRRAFLLCGPPQSKLVGLAFSEFAWTEDKQSDGPLIIRRCPQALLANLCGYKSTRSVRRRLDEMRDDGWVDYDNVGTGRGALKRYTLLVPDSVPRAVIDEFENPREGMWRRCQEALTNEAIPDTGVRRSEAELLPISGHGAPTTGHESPDHRTPVSTSPDTGFRSLGDISKSLVEGERGLRSAPPPTKKKMGRKGEHPPFEAMTQELLASRVAPSDRPGLIRVIENRWGFVPSDNVCTVLERQVNDRLRR